MAAKNSPAFSNCRVGYDAKRKTTGWIHEDINPNMITRWQREMAVNGSKAFLGKGVACDEETATLKRENNQLRKERDFLREAATFFASDQKRSIR